ncbi:hypothetical protein [Actinokineospora sp. NPDC004072]
MTTDFDRLLRDTLNRLADRAPDESAVRAALDRRRSPRLALTAVAAAVLVAALAVPLLRAGGPGGGPPARFPVAQVTETTPLLTPSWLPDGVTEQARTASPDGRSQSRSWHTGPLPAGERPVIRLSIHQDGPLVAPGDGEQTVALGDMGTARYIGAQMPDGRGIHTLMWNHDGNFVQLDGLAPLVDRDAVVRVALSLRPGVAPALGTSLEYTGRDLHEVEVGVRALAGEEQVQTLHGTAADSRFGSVRVELTPVEPAADPAGVEVVVLGKPVHLVASRLAPGQTGLADTLVVPAGDGRWLVLTRYGEPGDAASQRMLVAVAEALRAGPTPVNAWIGTR